MRRLLYTGMLLTALTTYGAQPVYYTNDTLVVFSKTNTVTTTLVRVSQTTNLFHGAGTTGNVTSVAGDATNFLRGDGMWVTITNGGGVSGPTNDWNWATQEVVKIEAVTGNWNWATSQVVGINIWTARVSAVTGDYSWATGKVVDIMVWTAGVSAATSTWNTVTNLFTGQDTTGQVSSAAGDAGKYLKADGTWATPPGGGGDYTNDWNAATNEARYASNQVDAINIWTAQVSAVTGNWNWATSQVVDLKAYTNALNTWTSSVSAVTSDYNWATSRVVDIMGWTTDVSIVTGNWNWATSQVVLINGVTSDYSWSTQQVVEIMGWTSSVGVWTTAVSAVTGDYSWATGQVHTLTGHVAEIDVWTSAVSAVTGDYSWATGQVVDINTWTTSVSSVTGDWNWATGEVIKIEAVTGDYTWATGQVILINAWTTSVSSVTDAWNAATNVYITNWLYSDSFTNAYTNTGVELRFESNLYHRMEGPTNIIGSTASGGGGNFTNPSVASIIISNDAPEVRYVSTQDMEHARSGRNGTNGIFGLYNRVEAPLTGSGNIAAYWDGTTNVGPNWVDISPFGMAATNVGTPRMVVVGTNQNGVVKYAKQFFATNYMKTGRNPWYTPSSNTVDRPWSLSLWMRFMNTAASEGIITKDASLEWELFYSSGNLTFNMFGQHNGSYAQACTKASPAINTNDWTLVTITYSGIPAAGAINMYLNTTNQGVTSSKNANYLYCSNALTGLQIGTYATSTWPFQGQLTGVEIWTNCLTQLEINGLYTTQHPTNDIYTTGQVWTTNEATGIEISDATAVNDIGIVTLGKSNEAVVIKGSAASGIRFQINNVDAGSIDGSGHSRFNLVHSTNYPLIPGTGVLSIVQTPTGTVINLDRNASYITNLSQTLSAGTSIASVVKSGINWTINATPVDTNYMNNFANRTNIQWNLDMTYDEAVDDTNTILWYCEFLRFSRATNIGWQCSDGAPVGDILFGTSSLALSTWASVAYTSMVFSQARSNLPVAFNINTGTRVGWRVTNGAGTNAKCVISGISP